VTLSEVADTAAAVGVAKTPDVVTDADAGDAVDVVLLPLGTTTKVYPVTSDNPVTVQLCDPVGAVVVLLTTHVRLPGVEVTTYVEATPSAVNVTVSEVALATTAVG
jgi:hypothetical protein